MEDHYYNAANTGFKELGLQPHLLTDDVLAEMISEVAKYKDRIDARKILPRVSWNNKKSA
jgi:UDP-sulfoquinovose synthase